MTFEAYNYLVLESSDKLCTLYVTKNAKSIWLVNLNENIAHPSLDSSFPILLGCSSAGFDSSVGFCSADFSLGTVVGLKKKIMINPH